MAEGAAEVMAGVGVGAGVGVRIGIWREVEGGAGTGVTGGARRDGGDGRSV